MSQGPARFQDTDRDGLAAFAESVLVRCPGCSARSSTSYRGRFSCASCGLTLSRTKTGVGLADAHAKQPCGRCGTQLSKRVRRHTNHTARIRVDCPACKRQNYIKVHWERPEPRSGNDPHFGFDLWLQTSCSGEELWAYNGDHLAFLKDFVAASLRERVPNRNGSLVSRLPTWMKSKKNRAAVLKGIGRLEGQLAD